MAEQCVETTIRIAAPPERVWAILTDFARMPQWNPLIRSISGAVQPGARLSVMIALPGRRAMRFRPTVLVAEPSRELRWRGSLVLPGLFDGEHYFMLQVDEAGGTHLVHGEAFSGFLVGLAMHSAMRRATCEGFEAMNQALKRQVEAEPIAAPAGHTEWRPTIRIEEEAPEHYGAVDALTRASFGGDYEADVLARLRDDGLVIAALVALDGAQVVGQVTLSDLPTELDEHPVRAACVAPLSVSQHYRQQGIGARLVEEAILVLRNRGYAAAFVIGDPHYYGRFGFSLAAARKIASPFPAAFMGLELMPGGLDGTSGSVRYPKAFQLEP
jgi:predicted N-acetyltransferase YhbS